MKIHLAGVSKVGSDRFGGMRQGEQVPASAHHEVRKQSAAHIQLQSNCILSILLMHNYSCSKVPTEQKVAQKDRAGSNNLSSNHA
jgi:hypothetical protein